MKKITLYALAITKVDKEMSEAGEEQFRERTRMFAEHLIAKHYDPELMQDREAFEKALADAYILLKQRQTRRPITPDDVPGSTLNYRNRGFRIIK